MNSEVRPKKALGQHFLIDQNIARKIVEQLSPDVETVIEVGAMSSKLTKSPSPICNSIFLHWATILLKATS